QLVPGVEGGFTVNHLTGEQTSIYDAAMAYQEAGVPLVVLAGKEYGSGSSRDWAAKGTMLLGVRAVIAESYERIHRSNLIGMGVGGERLPRVARAPGARRWGAERTGGPPAGTAPASRLRRLSAPVSALIVATVTIAPPAHATVSARHVVGMVPSAASTWVTS